MARKMTLKIEDMDPETPGIQTEPRRLGGMANSSQENVFASIGGPRRNMFGGQSFAPSMDGGNFTEGVNVVPGYYSNMEQAGPVGSAAAGGGMGGLDLFQILSGVGGIVASVLNSRADRKLAREMMERQNPKMNEAQRALQQELIANAGAPNPFTPGSSNSRLDKIRNDIASLQNSMRGKANPFSVG